MHLRTPAFRYATITLANLHSVLLVFLMPIGLNNIGWKMYMINGGWDIVVIVLIVSRVFHGLLQRLNLKAVFWVETKGKTLEEIDAIIQGDKHSNVPDLELVRTGKAKIDVGQVEQEIHTVVQTMKLD